MILNKIIKKLNYEKIKLNITAVFTLVQLKKIKSSINKKSPVIISIFCGRIADTGRDPVEYVKYAKDNFKNHQNVKILWASTESL